MPIHPTNESELLEAISEAEGAAGVLLAAYDALDDSVDALLHNIFHKDDYAVKFIVEPLLTNDGPLGEIMVRAKLLLGLGVISKEIYDDIEIFVTLREWAKVQGEDVSFTDENVLFELNRVNAIVKIMPIDFDADTISSLSGPMLKMFLGRHNQKVQSTIVLAITEIVNQLFKDNPLAS
ncbi:MltR family transcriptional regulator [Photobacterium sp. DNB23_23_1]|uniref:MltR family transcriptional regulator n=1 Tax=Photobacterium pectinilyticum TaxID=2906793 RepID=A0ABT1N745_9GAMM|nr:MltR family transcriptional regulator [Photobacterium sp. ZSDE20]MCQ1060541.1 MltR family transcriptional regulator [Photobacterium sp. ZSDE20]MDD1828006.1 MltR family transcriptional regulator [Photobacterium sp. ZSDE20]